MTTKTSPMLTNIDNKVILDSGLISGYLYSSSETVALLTTDIDANDIIHMLELPSNAKITSLVMYNDTLDSVADLTVDVGFYAARPFVDGTTAYAANAVIDFDALVTDSIALQAANIVGAELRYETQNITTVNDEIWELAGLASNPNVPLRLSLTIGTVAATAVAGDVTLRCTYLVK